MRVSEIRVSQIRVNQGLGVVLLLVYNQIMKKHSRVQYGLVNTIVEIKICASQNF